MVTANLSDPRSLDAIVAAANRAGPPSILVNAAGVFGPIQLIKDSDPREWIETLMINMVSHYLTSRARRFESMKRAAISPTTTAVRFVLCMTLSG